MNIIGNCLTDEEKKIISEIIRDDFAYKLGIVENEQNVQFKTFIFLNIGLIVAGILLWLTQEITEIPRMVFFVLFGFMGDRLFKYVFITRHELHRKKRLAGRLASVKIIFSDTYEKRHYTEDEINKLYAELEIDSDKII